MPNWKYKLNIVDIIKDYEDSKSTIPEFVDSLSKRIHESEIYKVQEYKVFLDLTITALKDCDNEEQVDDVLTELYDWADKGNKLWINPFPEQNV